MTQAPTTTITKSKPGRTRTPRPPSPPRPSRVRRIADGLWWIESRSHPGTGHRTTVDSCTCPAARFGRPVCRHKVMVRELEAWRKREEAEARAARAAEKVQAANWSSAEKTEPVTKSAQEGAPATSSVAAPLRQTGDLPQLSRWFE